MGANVPKGPMKLTMTGIIGVATPAATIVTLL
jgi:hypothetical protein